MKKHLLRMLSFGLQGCLALGVQSLSADPIGLAGSLRIAQERYSEAHTSGLKSEGFPDFKLAYIGTEKAIMAVSSLRSSAVEDALLYVYNVGDDRGFVIVSGEDQGKQLLGISDSGSFPTGGLSGNMNNFLMMYTRYVKALRSGAIVAQTAGTKAGSSDTDVSEFPERVIPLVKTKWEVGYPYSASCPEIGGYLSEAGPAAVAMAQIMSFHKYPAGGVGHISYKYAGSSHGFGGTLTGSKYYWDEMPVELNEKSSDREIDDVSTLIFHCGIAARSNYEYGSTADNEDVWNAFVENFQYDKNLQLYDRAFFSENEWTTMLKTELAAMRPVYYSGEGGENNQGYSWSFVCDGYNKDNLFHLKTGYAGDGYFELGAINIGFYSQNEHQQMITGIRKPTAESEPATLLEISSIDIEGNGQVKLGDNLPISFSLSNFGADGDYYIFSKLFKEDEAIEVRREDYGANVELIDNFKRGELIEGNTFTFDVPDSTATYYIYVVGCKAGESVMKPIRTANHPYDYVVVDVKDGNVTLSKAERKLSADPVKVTYDADNNTAVFEVTFHNNQQADYYGTAGLLVKAPGLSAEEYSWEVNNLVNIPAGESRNVSFTGGFDWTVGDTLVVVATYQSGLRDLWYPFYTDIEESTRWFALKVDGSLTVSNETIEQPATGFEYTFDPVSGLLALQSNALMTNLMVYRYDGQAVCRYPIGSQTAYSTYLSIPTGHYILMVQTGQGTEVRKFYKK